MNFRYVSFGAAPIVLAISLPPLKSKSEGIDWTLYLIAISWFSSTFSLVTLTLPAIIFPTCSTAGPTILHGPHHSAQKSTNTGTSDLSTSSSHSLVVTWVTALLFSVLLSILPSTIGGILILLPILPKPTCRAKCDKF